MRCKACNRTYMTSRFVVQHEGFEEDLCADCRQAVKDVQVIKHNWYQYEGAHTGLTKPKSCGLDYEMQNIEDFDR